MSSRNLRLAAVALFAASICGCASTGKKTDSSTRDFTFLHISDTHIGPWLEEKTDFTGQRSDATFQFLQKVCTLPQPVLADGGTVPPPQFIVHTGDLTEYGFPGATLAAVDSYQARIPLPIHWAPGNHDNTWVSRPDLYRARMGGMHSHFEHDGVHFLAVSAATLQEPIQSMGEEEVGFVRSWAKRIPVDAPVFLFLHHPPIDEGWSSEYDFARLMEPLRDHNVTAILAGHHHAAKHERWSGYDVLHGGSTFSNSDVNSVDGFSVIHMTGDHIHAAYRYKDDRIPPMQYIDRSILPDPTAVHLSNVKAQTSGDELTVSWTSSTDAPTTITIAGLDDHALLLRPGKTTSTHDVSSLTNGRHWGKISAAKDGKLATERFFEYTLNRPGRAGEGNALWTVPLGGGVKGRPLLDGGQIVVGANNETLQAIDLKSGKVNWRIDTPGEILGSPVLLGENLAAATTDGFVLAIDPKNGHEIRRARVPKGLPLYSAPLVTNGLVIVGGTDANLFALDANTFELRWTASGADYSVEMPPIVSGDSLIYNAWDGYMHCASIADGTERWKVAGPKNQEKLSRYLAPADYSPIAMGDRIYTADRGYASGAYSTKGEYLAPLLDDCTALAPTEDGKGFLARRLTHPVCRVDPTGKIEWESSIKAGRLPAPPVEKDGKVYIVTKGILYVLNGADGQVEWKYQVTPGLYVMPEPVVADGKAYVVGMDGVLTAMVGPR